MKRQTDPQIRLLQAAADSTRMAILRMLGECGTVCACDFTDCCGVAQPTVSHHLKVLRDAGWVRSERRGSWVYYSLEPRALERFRAIAAALTPAGTPISALEPDGKRLPVIQPTA